MGSDPWLNVFIHVSSVIASYLSLHPLICFFFYFDTKEVLLKAFQSEVFRCQHNGRSH